MTLTQPILVPSNGTFPDQRLGLNLALASGAAYNLESIDVMGQGFVELDANDLKHLVQSSRCDWEANHRSRFTTAGAAAISTAYDQFQADYKPERAFGYIRGKSFGLEMVFFVSQSPSQPNILAIAGRDDNSTTVFAATKIIFQGMRITGRMSHALEFARKLAHEYDSFWVTGHSTGAVEGASIFARLSEVKGGLFFNPVNSSHLRKAAKLNGEKPLQLVTSQEEKGDFSWRYLFDFEKLVTGLWKPLPRTSGTLHFDDPDFGILSGHRLATSTAALLKHYKIVNDPLK